MSPLELQAITREVRGKKVRFLRRKGIVPLHIFGHNVESVALQCEAAQLQQVLPQAGKTGIISLRLDGETEPRSVMVREIQRDILTGELLHVDFYQVSMAEQIKAQVPIVLVGQAPALRIKENMLVQELRNLSIECLPGQIPSSIELDVGSLTEVHQEIRVKNIRLDEKICVITEPDVVIARIGVQRVEEVPEKVVAEVAPAEEVAAAAEAEEKPEKEGE